MFLEDLMTFVFVIVLVSIVMGTIGGVAKRALRSRDKRIELEAGHSGPANKELLEKLASMEERLRNLERIATDDRPSLAAQIEALRLEDATPASIKEDAR